MPRMLALICMMPLLTAYGNVMGMIGGGVVAPLFDISPAQYYHQVVGSVDLANYSAGIIKSFFFGVIVAGAGCLKGISIGEQFIGSRCGHHLRRRHRHSAIILLDAVFAFGMAMLGM